MNEEQRKNFNKLVSKGKSDLMDTLQWREDNSYWLKTSADIAIKMLSAMDHQNITKDDLNELTSISKVRINKMLKGSYNFSLKEIKKIEIALNIEFVNIQIPSWEEIQKKLAVEQNIKGITTDKNHIFGIMFQPVRETEEEYAQTFRTATLGVSENYMKAYRNHIAGMQIVAGCAKAYIYENYTKIFDWSNLNVIINDNSGVAIDYYNFKEPKPRTTEKKSEVLHRFSNRITSKNKQRHNPIVTLTDVVLDPSDGDLSMTINGRNHLWISDDSVMIIAEFIEKTLNEKSKIN